MSRSGPVIRYRANGVIMGKRPLGRKIQDDVTGFWTYEDLLMVNDFGEMVVGGGEGEDYLDDTPNVNLAPGDLPTSTPNNSNVPWNGLK